MAFTPHRYAGFGFVLAFAFVCTFTLERMANADVAGPIKVSADHRHFQDAERLTGLTCWLMENHLPQKK